MVHSIVELFLLLKLLQNVINPSLTRRSRFTHPVLRATMNHSLCANYTTRISPNVRYHLLTSSTCQLMTVVTSFLGFSRPLQMILSVVVLVVKIVVKKTFPFLRLKLFLLNVQPIFCAMRCFLKWSFLCCTSSQLQ